MISKAPLDQGFVPKCISRRSGQSIIGIIGRYSKRHYQQQECGSSSSSRIPDTAGRHGVSQGGLWAWNTTINLHGTTHLQWSNCNLATFAFMNVSLSKATKMIAPPSYILQWQLERRGKLYKKSRVWQSKWWTEDTIRHWLAHGSQNKSHTWDACVAYFFEEKASSWDAFKIWQSLLQKMSSISVQNKQSMKKTTKFLYTVDLRIQCWLANCKMATGRLEVNDSII